jgi:uncharacterized protein YdaU (DUF1376 family)
MKNKKIRYVSLEPRAFLTDLDFLSMTAEEKGVYFSIILCLYDNNGYLDMDKERINRVCNCPNFENVFEKIKHKFRIKDGKISHKRVLRELKRARQIAQLHSANGVKGNEIRWKNHPTGNPSAIAQQSQSNRIKRSEEKRSEVKRREGKRSEDKKSSEERNEEAYYASPSDSSNGSSQRLASQWHGLPRRATHLAQQAARGITAKMAVPPIPRDLTMKIVNFNDELCRIFPKRTPSDTSSIRNLANWVRDRIRLGLFQDKIIGNVLTIARDSKKGKSRKPIAVFYARLKKELNYGSDG